MLKSKLQGDEVEDTLVSVLSKFGQTQKNTEYGLRYEYDVECNISDGKVNYKLTFECKNDVMAKKTGNVAIEYHNSKKNEPSGVSRTSAVFWAHKIGGIIWIVSVKALKDFIDVTKPVKVIESGGDDNANLLIYRIDDFTTICKPLEEFQHANDFIDML